MTMDNRLNYYKPLNSITITNQALTAYCNLTFSQWQFQQQISQLSQTQNTSATLFTATGYYYIYCVMAHVQNPTPEWTSPTTLVVEGDFSHLSAAMEHASACSVPVGAGECPHHCHFPSPPSHSKPSLTGNNSVVESLYSPISLLHYSQ
jgi:hypothetical protein